MGSEIGYEVERYKCVVVVRLTKAKKCANSDLKV